MSGTGTLLLLLAVSDVKAEAPKTPVAVDYDWSASGKRATAAMPRELHDGPLLPRVHFLAERFAAELVLLGIAPNFDERGRKRAHQRYGPDHSSIGTCGHTTNAFNAYLMGAGIPRACIKQRAGIKLRFLDGKLMPALDLNADHVAAVITIGKESLVFDFWRHGRDRNTFAGFTQSPCCGQPLPRWDECMRQEGYSGPWYTDEEAYRRLFDAK